jgi:hypothetical protein
MSAQGGAIAVIDGALAARVLAMNPSCRRLNLSRNQIVAVVPEPQALPLLQSLIHLNLSFNGLRALGPEFSALSRLQVLDVSHNQMCAAARAAGARLPPATAPLSNCAL